MDANCTVVCCKEEEEADKAVIVQFSNGILRDTEHLDFTFYMDKDKNNPRRKSRRMVVAESERLSYVGNNFGTGSLKCNNLCKYYVGVLNKQTMQMEVHNAQLFNMKPVIPGEVTESNTPQNTNQTYREKLDSLVEAFGTNKQKRALSSRRMNQVGSDTLQQAVASAAGSIIEQKGLEALQEEVAQTEAQSDVALYLPPCHADAATPDQVYLFNDLLTPVEYDSLKEAGDKMAALTKEELQKMKDQGGNLSVLWQLEGLPAEGPVREKRTRCAFYLRLLIKLAKWRRVTGKFWAEENCPRPMQNKVLRTFTVETFSNGRLQNMVSASMSLKVATYCLALLLHMGHMTANLTLLQRDLGITENRMLDIAKAMGLTLLRAPRGKAAGAGPDGEHKMASLVLPLVKYEAQLGPRKRRKML